MFLACRYLLGAHQIVNKEKFLERCNVTVEPRVEKSFLGRGSILGVLADHLVKEVLPLV